MKTLLLAAAVALLAPTPPFPAPKLTGTTPETRCDWGPITEAKNDGTRITLKTDAGPLELTIGAGVKVAAADGKATALSTLRMGMNVRAYYLVDGGAKAIEIDVLQ